MSRQPRQRQYNSEAAGSLAIGGSAPSVQRPQRREKAEDGEKVDIEREAAVHGQVFGTATRSLRDGEELQPMIAACLSKR